MEAKGGGEVRRLHIIYFLSHTGRVDHPHLIRVHHLTRCGVYLRDIKRWLADLRGIEIAEAYAWSYKRRYKTGYVWQDLLDDDLITPISDNEYVLKGSEIISAAFDAPSNVQYAVENKAASVHKEQQHPTELVEDHKLDQPTSLLKQDFQTYPDSKIQTPTKSSSEINQESPQFGSERSILTDDIESDESMKMEDHSSSSFYSNREMNKNMMKKKKKKKNMEGKDQMQGTPASSHSSSFSSSSSSSTTTTTSSKSAFTKSKSYSSGASYVLRNLMSCGAVDTNDAVLVTLNANKQRTSSQNDILKGNKLGGSARVFGTRWNPQQQQQQQQKHSASSSSRKSCEGEKDNSKKQQQRQRQSQSQRQREFTNQKAVSAAYRPVREPNCSQCGKPFKPEKMHSHMKSCRGMKALAKAAPTSSLNKAPSHSNFNDSASAYLLTN